MDQSFNDERNDTPFVKQIHRFKFSEDFTKQLNQFSKLHQNDNRKDYKEAWVIWSNGNKEIIKNECQRLNDLGYHGNIHDKMFRSSRYYFRKKPVVKPEPKKRRKYTSCEHELLLAMDKQISEISKKKMPPAEGYSLFCLNNRNMLSDEIVKIVENGINDKEMIQNKIKKTYKNRYFLYI